jgi:hypothetical protein
MAATSGEVEECRVIRARGRDGELPGSGAHQGAKIGGAGHAGGAPIVGEQKDVLQPGQVRP